MKKILEFIEKYSLGILILLILLQTCTSSASKKASEKKFLNQLDSIKTEIKYLQKEIKVEGLKSEKRMIQSTDRKILDVNRQAEIDKELKQIEK
jgi:hypothetical protein